MEQTAKQIVNDLNVEQSEEDNRLIGKFLAILNLPEDQRPPEYEQIKEILLSN